MFPWFAIQVRARGEFLVEHLLRERRFETFLPSTAESRQYSDRVKKIETALFPGYLFCRFDSTKPLPILNTAGVQQILSFNGKPAPLEESEVASIQRLMHSRVKTQPWPFLAAGDRVRVEFGSFSGVEGTLISEKGTDLLVVSVTLLQRSVCLQIERSWIKPLTGSPRIALAM